MIRLTKQQMERLLKDTVVKNDDGTPRLVYRGEHGSTDGGDPGVRSLYPSLSFGDAQTASLYAMEPNDRKHTAESPRVYPAYLIIKKPFIVTDGDPFVDFAYLEKHLGKDVAVQFFLKNANKVEETNNWQDDINADDKWSGIREFYQNEPDRMGELYTELFPMLDDPEFIKILQAKGYDGAIYGGSGANALDDEYRVFDQSGVIYALSMEVTPKPRLQKSLEIDGLAA